LWVFADDGGEEFGTYLKFSAWNCFESISPFAINVQKSRDGPEFESKAFTSHAVLNIKTTLSSRNSFRYCNQTGEESVWQYAGVRPLSLIR